MLEKPENRDPIIIIIIIIIIITTLFSVDFHITITIQWNLSKEDIL